MPTFSAIGHIQPDVQESVVVVVVVLLVWVVISLAVVKGSRRGRAGRRRRRPAAFSHRIMRQDHFGTGCVHPLDANLSRLLAEVAGDGSPKEESTREVTGRCCQGRRGGNRMEKHEVEGTMREQVERRVL